MYEESSVGNLSPGLESLAIKEISRLFPQIISALEKRGVFVNKYEENTLGYVCSDAGIDLESFFDTFPSQLKQVNSMNITQLSIISGVDKKGHPEKIERLDISSGELVVLVGPTGSGKSQLLKDIESLTQEDSITKRRILLNNLPPSDDLIWANEIKPIAKISQGMNFLLDIKVKEFIDIHAKSRNVSENKDLYDNILSASFSLCGEPFDLNENLVSLSGGQSRALMIVDAILISKAPVILVDELENAGINIDKAMEFFKKENKIIIMATHDPLIALGASKRVSFKNGAMKKLIFSTEKEKGVFSFFKDRAAEKSIAIDILRSGQIINSAVFLNNKETSEVKTLKPIRGGEKNMNQKETSKDTNSLIFEELKKINSRIDQLEQLVDKGDSDNKLSSEKEKSSILSHKKNTDPQIEYFAELRKKIEEDEKFITEGKYKPAPMFPSETLKPKEIEEAKALKRLLYLNLEFCNVCNLGCEGCWNGYATDEKTFDITERHKPITKRDFQLSMKQNFDIIDQAAELGVKYLDFIGGGEPLLSKDFFSLVSYATEKGIKSETFTNGTMINKEIAEQLYKYNVIPFVKVYSLDPKKHDIMVNRKGAHKKVIEALDHLRNAGYGDENKIVIETIITNKNINEMPKMWRFAREHGYIPYFERFVGLEYCGSPVNLPSPNELFELWKTILDIDKREYGYIFPMLPLRIGYTCSSAFFSLYIQSDGVVRPCAGSFEILGDTTKQSLENILKTSESVWKLRNLETTNKGYCSKCPYFEKEYCPGCRGMALFHENNLVADDPLCFHILENRKKIYGGKFDR